MAMMKNVCKYQVPEAADIYNLLQKLPIPFHVTVTNINCMKLQKNLTKMPFNKVLSMFLQRMFFYTFTIQPFLERLSYKCVQTYNAMLVKD